MWQLTGPVQMTFMMTILELYQNWPELKDELKARVRVLLAEAIAEEKLQGRARTHLFNKQLLSVHHLPRMRLVTKIRKGSGAMTAKGRKLPIPGPSLLLPIGLLLSPAHSKPSKFQALRFVSMDNNIKSFFWWWFQEVCVRLIFVLW